MKRTTLLLSLVAAGLFVALIPARPVPTIPTVPSSVIEVPVSATSVAYCGWVRSDSAIDMSVQLASSRDTQATVTVLQNGGVVSSEPRVVAPFGSVRVASVLPVGVEGSIVEFAAGPAAATAVGDGVLGLVAASCPSTVPDVWVLGGGSTAEGLTLDLRLFNPFPEDAKLTIRALSENGSEPDQSLEAVSVPAQSGRTIALADILGFREWLSVEIEQVDGRVIPTFVEQASAGGAAVLSGVAAASEWYFPFGGVPELANTLVLVNPSATPIGYQVGRSTSSGAGDELDRGSVDPRQVATIELAAGEGYIVQADGPMAAFLVSRGEGGRASVAGSTVSAKDWLLPGVGALPETTVVILNPTLDDITATVVSRLGQDKVVVAAGGVTSVSAQVSEGGMQVSATGPVVVGWYAVSENGVAYAIGLPYVNE